MPTRPLTAPPDAPVHTLSPAATPPHLGAPRALAAAWAGMHLLPIALLPVLTHGLGAAVGLDGAAALTHASTVVALPVLQALVLRRLWGRGAWWTGRALLGFAGACAVAMVAMSSIDLAGFDLLATPVAMTLAGAIHGLVLGWPLRRAGRLGAWVAASAAGWLLGTGLYRLLLAYGLAWTLGDRSAYGYAYTGGHNELLWIGAGLAGFGAVTAWALARFPSEGA